jgi:hypothetical protein
MMPHERCQRSSCWLNSFFAIKNIPLPKFYLGQRVRFEYVSDDDDQTYVDRGTVMGLFLAPYGWLEGWWYCVSWEVLPRVTWLSLPHLEEVHEDHLEAIAEEMN